MKRLSNRTIGVDQGTVTLFSDFDSGGEMWTGSGPRVKRVAVKFATAFATAPAVHVSLSMLDIVRNFNQRLDLGAEDITCKGFVIAFRTWGDTKFARARASWMVVGEMPGDDDWDID